MIDFFSDPFDDGTQSRDPLYGKHGKNLMKTDVRETESSYELDIDLPGFKKDEIHLALDHGYLTISAEKSLEKDKENEKGKMLRQERYSGRDAAQLLYRRSSDRGDVKGLV